MKDSELADIVGVCRQAIWKIKNNYPVVEETSKKIEFITGGCVKPAISNKGKRAKL